MGQRVSENLINQMESSGQKYVSRKNEKFQMDHDDTEDNKLT